jgi:alpha-1,6-mannosyltransferase
VPDLLARSPHYLTPAHGYLAAFGVSFLLYLLSIRLARSTAANPRALLHVIAGGALAMRLVLLPAPPTLTTDHLRYLWDGRVARHGVNPYRFPPDARELRDLRIPGWERINYPGTRTPYPPLAEVTFWLNAVLVGDSVLGLKVLFTACDLATVWLLLRLLRALGRPERNLLIYAWHPLVVTETALSAHLEAEGVFLLVVALWSLCPRRRHGPSPATQGGQAIHHQRPGIAGMALGLSVGVKSLTVLYLPAMVRRRGWAVFWAAAGVVAALHLPILLSGAPLQGGAQAMAAYWVSNPSLYPILEWISGLALRDKPDAARSAARFLVGMCVLTAALLAGRGDRKTTGRCEEGTAFENLTGDLYAVMMLLFLLSPVVMPWYLVWLVPFLVFRPRPSGFAFTALVTLAYLIPAHRWRGWFTWVEYTPVYLLFAMESLKRWRNRR